MIVCVCKNINTAKITESIRAGACSIDEIKARTGAMSCCGKCQFKVNSVLQAENKANQPNFYDAAISA